MSVGGLWGLLGFVLGRVWGEGEQLSVSNPRPELVYILVTLIKFQEEKVREGSVCFSLCFEGLRSYPLSPIYSGMAASWRKNELEGSCSLYDGRKQKEWERCRKVFETWSRLCPPPSDLLSPGIPHFSKLPELPHKEQEQLKKCLQYMKGAFRS